MCSIVSSKHHARKKGEEKGRQAKEGREGENREGRKARKKGG